MEVNMDTKQFLGLSKKSAQNLAEVNNLIFRLIRVDDVDFFSYPEDLREDRVCIEIEKSQVVAASIR